MWAEYPVPISCHLDHSYAVEVYTSWVMCRVRSMLLAFPHIACVTTRSLREGGDFIASRPFIIAVHRPPPSELGMWLVDLLLAECIDHAAPFGPPHHLYSRQEGTFPDLVLDEVDGAATAQALQQPYPIPVGYIADLRTDYWHTISVGDITPQNSNPHYTVPPSQPGTKTPKPQPPPVPPALQPHIPSQ